MNIFLHELKANLKSLLIWSVILVLMIIIALGKFSAFAGDESLLSVLDALPTSMLDALSMRAFNLTTVSGFFGILFLYFSLMGAVAAAMWGSMIISKEERDKTVEFSLVLPISRSKLITAKAFAALVNCIAFVLITWITSTLAIQSFTPDQATYDFLKLEMLAMFLVELIFLAVGLLLGCSMNHYKRAGSTAVAIILSTYFISIFSKMQESFDNLKYLTPFRYYDAIDLLQSGKIDPVYLGITSVIVVICLIFAYNTYNHRDLTI